MRILSVTALVVVATLQLVITQVQSTPTMLDVWEVDDSFRGFDAFGRAGDSVAISSNGRILAYGVPGSTFGGHVEVVRHDDQDGTVYRDVLLLHVEDYQQARFGTSVAMSEDGRYIIAGAPGVGAAQIFAWNNNELTYRPLPNGIISADESSGLGYDVSVTLDQEGQPYFAVGSPHVNDNTGSVSVYSYNFGDDALVRWGPDLAGEGRNNRFGTTVELAVAARGLSVAIGAPGTGTSLEGGRSNTLEVGQVYVYDVLFDDEQPDDAAITWQLVFSASSQRSCGGSLDFSPDGNNLVAGCPYWEDDGGYSVGRAFVFHRSGATFVSRGSVGPFSFEYENVATSVAISDDGLALLSCLTYSPDNPGYGLCHVYRFDGQNSWNQVDNGEIVGNSEQEFLGSAVAATGDFTFILAGAPSYDHRENGTHRQDSGRLFLFRALSVAN